MRKIASLSNVRQTEEYRKQLGNRENRLACKCKSVRESVRKVKTKLTNYNYRYRNGTTAYPPVNGYFKSGPTIALLTLMQLTAISQKKALLQSEYKHSVALSENLKLTNKLLVNPSRNNLDQLHSKVTAVLSLAPIQDHKQEINSSYTIQGDVISQVKGYTKKQSLSLLSIDEVQQVLFTSTKSLPLTEELCDFEMGDAIAGLTNTIPTNTDATLDGISHSVIVGVADKNHHLDNANKIEDKQKLSSPINDLTVAFDSDQCSVEREYALQPKNKRKRELIPDTTSVLGNTEEVVESTTISKQPEQDKKTKTLFNTEIVKKDLHYLKSIKSSRLPYTVVKHELIEIHSRMRKIEQYLIKSYDANASRFTLNHRALTWYAHSSDLNRIVSYLISWGEWIRRTSKQLMGIRNLRSAATKAWLQKLDNDENHEDFRQVKKRFDRIVRYMPEGQRLSIYDQIFLGDQVNSWYALIKGEEFTPSVYDWPKSIRLAHVFRLQYLLKQSRDCAKIPRTIFYKLMDIGLQIKQNKLRELLSVPLLPSETISQQDLSDYFNGRSILNLCFRNTLEKHNVKNFEKYSLDDTVIRIFDEKSSFYRGPVTKTLFNQPSVRKRIFTKFTIYDILVNNNEPQDVAESIIHNNMHQTWREDVIGTNKYSSELISDLLSADCEEWWRRHPKAHQETWRFIKSSLVNKGVQSIDDVQAVVFTGPLSWYRAVGVFKISYDNGRFRIVSVLPSPINANPLDWTFNSKEEFNKKLEYVDNEFETGKSYFELLFYNSKIKPKYISWFNSDRRWFIPLNINKNGDIRDYVYWEAEDILQSGSNQLDVFVKSDSEIKFELAMKWVSASLQVASTAAAPMFGHLSLLLGLASSLPYFVNAQQADTEKQAMDHAIDGLTAIVAEFGGVAVGNLVAKIWQTGKAGIKAAKRLTESDFSKAGTRNIVKSLQQRQEFSAFVDMIMPYPKRITQQYRSSTVDMAKLSARYTNDQKLAIVELIRKGVCWDAVYRLEYLSGKISKEALSQLTSNTRSIGGTKVFLGEKPNKIKVLSDLENLPKGSRVAFVRDDRLVHAMISVNGGDLAYGANNAYIGGNPGWVGIELKKVLTATKEGFILKSDGHPIEIFSSAKFN